MRTVRLRNFLAATLAVSCLTACDVKGHGEVPALSDHFAKLLPPPKRLQVEAVRVCHVRTKWLEGSWFATVFFFGETQTLYHYRLNVPAGPNAGLSPVELEYTNDEAQRSAHPNRALLEGCYSARREDVAYQIEFKEGVTSYAPEYFAVQAPFDAKALAHLQRAAQAVELAAHLHSSQKPLTP
jgi:hypothetical protein